ncbi:MAG: septation protein SpoVG family protein [Lachnospiraceae bacterium]
MNITNVQLNMFSQPRVENKKRLVAYATLTFDGIFVVNSIKVYKQPRRENVYIEMPKHPMGTEMRDTYFPISNVFRKKMECAIKEELKKCDPVT